MKTAFRLFMLLGRSPSCNLGFCPSCSQDVLHRVQRKIKPMSFIEALAIYLIVTGALVGIWWLFIMTVGNTVHIIGKIVSGFRALLPDRRHSSDR